MSICLVVLLAGVAFAHYDRVPSRYPAPYNPSGYPELYNPPMNHLPRRYSDHYDSDSSSESRDSSSESAEVNSCRSCNQLKLYKNETFLEAHSLVDSLPTISYTSDKGKCLKAIINCPLDSLKPYMLLVTYKGDVVLLGTPPFAERVATCKKNGKYQANAILLNGTDSVQTLVNVEFSTVACVTRKIPV